jgi:hypothetical protein
VIELPKGGCPWKEHLYRLEEEMGKDYPRAVFLLNVAEHNVNVSERERYLKLLVSSVADPGFLSRIRIFSIPDPHQRI